MRDVHGSHSSSWLLSWRAVLASQLLWYLGGTLPQCPGSALCKESRQFPSVGRVNECPPHPAATALCISATVSSPLEGPMGRSLPFPGRTADALWGGTQESTVLLFPKRPLRIPPCLPGSRGQSSGTALLYISSTHPALGPHDPAGCSAASSEPFLPFPLQGFLLLTGPFAPRDAQPVPAPAAHSCRGHWVLYFTDTVAPFPGNCPWKALCLLSCCCVMMMMMMMIFIAFSSSFSCSLSCPVVVSFHPLSLPLTSPLKYDGFIIRSGS